LNGHIWLVGVCFPIELFHPFKYDGGKDSVKIWILISELPQYLWKNYEIHEVAKEFGRVL
jgi:hypothetical protein